MDNDWNRKSLLPHIIPRLKKVIEGDDRRNFFWETIGRKEVVINIIIYQSSLLKDSFGQYIINDNLNDKQLKSQFVWWWDMIFKFKTDQYWQDGKSTETDYIYILNSTV